MVRVLIVDDSRLVRYGLQSLLERQCDLEVCGSAASGRLGVAMAAATAPDVVIMDLSMPDLDGVEATRQIVHDCPGTRVVVLTADAAPATERAAMAAGAARYVLKGTEPGFLLEAIRGVVREDGLPHAWG